jgi:predicted Zn-dependent protease with MMP-like domain
MAKKGKLSRKKFERLVGRAIATLPEEFRSKLDNVAVLIEEDPPEDMPDTLGLYEGVPLTERSFGDIILPDRITLFKRTIESSCYNEDKIEVEIRLTLLHEIGHHFGLEEEQME